jgi:hypothetical protein
MAASFLDLFGLEGSGPAAQRLLGFGLLVSLPCYVAGLADWRQARKAGDRRIGVIHLGGDGTLCVVIRGQTTGQAADSSHSRSGRRDGGHAGRLCRRASLPCPGGRARRAPVKPPSGPQPPWGASRFQCGRALPAGGRLRAPVRALKPRKPARKHRPSIPVSGISGQNPTQSQTPAPLSVHAYPPLEPLQRASRFTGRRRGGTCTWLRASVRRRDRSDSDRGRRVVRSALGELRFAGSSCPTTMSATSGRP